MRARPIVSTLVVLALAVFGLLVALQWNSRTPPSTDSELEAVYGFDRPHGEDLVASVDSTGAGPPSREREDITLREPDEAATKTTERLRLRVVLDRFEKDPPPVPGAHARVIDTRREGGRPRWDLIAEGDADAGGLVEFDVPRYLTLHVHAEARIEGRLNTGAARFDSGADLTATNDVRIREPDADAFRGVVLDRLSLQPIAAANVRTSDGQEPRTTDAQGRFSLENAANVWIERDGYHPADSRDSGLRDGSGAATFFLNPSARLRGTALDARGKPRPPTEVHVTMPRDGDSFERIWDARPVEMIVNTDADGRFDFANLPAGVPLSIDARMAGESGTTAREDLELEPGETRVLALRLRGHVELSGHVFDIQGRPLTEGHVSAGDEVARAGGPIRSDGSYYLPFVASGSGWIEVSQEAPGPEIGYCTGARLNIPIDAIEWNFDLRLGRSSSIAGRLLEADGRPVRNGIIRLDGVDANPLARSIPVPTADLHSMGFSRGNTSWRARGIRAGSTPAAPRRTLANPT